MVDGPAPTSLPPVWLSHHRADESHRCIRFGRVHLCRRCTFILVGFLPAVAVLVSPWRDDLQTGDYGLVLALTIVAGLEFVQVARGRMLYSARRVVVLSPAVGAAEAWLFVNGIRHGLSWLHVVAGLAGLLILVAVFGRSSWSGPRRPRSAGRDHAAP